MRRKTNKQIALLNEIKIMRHVRHENLIQLQEVYENERYVYLVLELLRGGELFDFIVSKGHYSEKDAVLLMMRLISAVEYLSRKGIMHRDIKPENLILKEQDNKTQVKLIDFGLAAHYRPDGDYLFKRCGTPGYVAPEILFDRQFYNKSSTMKM